MWIQACILMEDRCKRIFIFFFFFFWTDKMIVHPLRRGGAGAASGKQFTYNVLMVYWLFVRPSMCFLLVWRACICEDFKYSLSLSVWHTHSICVSFHNQLFSFYSLSPIPRDWPVHIRAFKTLECSFLQTVIPGLTPAILLLCCRERSIVYSERVVGYNKEIVLSASLKARTLQENLIQVTKKS